MKHLSHQTSGLLFMNTLEFFDIAIFAALSPYLIHIFSMNGVQDSELWVWGVFFVRYVSRPIGGYMLTQITKRCGAKFSLQLTGLITALCSLSIALMPVYDMGLVFVFLFLFFQLGLSFSFGGEYPLIIHTIFHRSSGPQSQKSGWIVISSIMAVIFGSAIVWLLGVLLSHDTMMLWGWRVPFLISVLNVMLSYRIRKNFRSYNQQKIKFNFDIRSLLNVFFISVSGAVIFYSYNFGSKILGKALQLNHFSIISSIILVIMITMSGYLVGRFTQSKTIFKIGLLTLAVSAPLIYWMLQTHMFFYIILAQGLMAILASLNLGNLATVLYDISKNNLNALGLGYNLALSIIGGVTPLLISLLLPEHFVYIGLFISSCVLISYLSLSHPFKN